MARPAARIVNRTSYPTKTVERLVTGVLRDADQENANLRIEIVHSRHQWATGHWEFLGGAFGAAEIVIRLPRRGVKIGDYHPYERTREQGKRFPLADWREALVAIAAHEVEHHRQRWTLGERKGTRPRRNRQGEIVRQGSGSRRSQVEVRCDLAAYRAWRRYREARGLAIEQEAA